MTPQQEIAFWRRNYQQLLNTPNGFVNSLPMGGAALGGQAALRTGGATGTTSVRRRNRSRSRARTGGATGVAIR
jgi:hypothetical protein